MARQSRCGHRRRMTGDHHPPTYLVTVQVNSRFARESLLRLAEKFTLSRRERHDPHITLFGPFTLVNGCDPELLLRQILPLSRVSVPSCTARLGDPLLLRGMRGFAAVVRAVPDEHLCRIAARIRENLLPYTRSCTWIDQRPGQRIFHVSVGFGLREGRARKILDFLETTSAGTRGAEGIGRLEGTTIESFRLSVIRRGALWKVFDFPMNRWIGRGKAFGKGEEIKTLEAFRKRMGFQLYRPHFYREAAAFVISDLHLGHENIITYTSRPFPDAAAMDDVLIRNWNFRVKPTDTVYFLGDLAYGRNTRRAADYLPLLAGVIHRVAGNHDTGLAHTRMSIEVCWKGQRFLMVHDPADAPPDYPGFIIHGHLHNNQPGEFPFLNMEKRRVNVSAEMVGYVPLSLDELVEIIGASPYGARFSTLADARRALPLT